MSKVYDIGVLPGDGIGEEVVREALKVLDAVQDVFGFQTKREVMPYGAEHFLKTGETMPEAAFDRIRHLHAVIFGAIGDPRIEVGKLEFAIIAGMRHKLDLYVNLRPVKLYHEALCPLKGKMPADIDMIFCRENTEDAYAGIFGFTKRVLSTRSRCRRWSTRAVAPSALFVTRLSWRRSADRSPARTSRRSH